MQQPGADYLMSSISALFFEYKHEESKDFPVFSKV
jgi:hypothetical protein